MRLLDWIADMFRRPDIETEQLSRQIHELSMKSARAHQRISDAAEVEQKRLRTLQIRAEVIARRKIHAEGIK